MGLVYQCVSEATELIQLERTVIRQITAKYFPIIGFQLYLIN